MKIRFVVLTLLAASACKAGGDLATVPAVESFDMVAGQRQSFDDLRDKFGGPLEGHVKWTSTDPAVATVDQDGMVTAIHSGVANVSEIGDNASAAVAITVNQGGMVDPDSGTIYSDDRTFWMTRTAGTFGALGAFTFTKLPTPALANVIPGTGWGLSSGGEFLVTIRYDPAQLPVGANPIHLQLRRIDGVAIGTNISDTVAHTVTLHWPLTDIPKMALVLEPIQIDSIRLSFQYVLTVGNHEPVDLQAFGSDASGVTVHWQSSDPTTIAVSDGGEVSALRAGTVTIRAEMDGAVGTLAVTAVP